MSQDITPVFKPYEGNEPFIFISYSHRNSDMVFPIIQKLHERGLRVWYDRGIDPGSEWPEEIANHLIGCGLFLLFMSPEAAESHNVRREITMAVDRKKPLMNVYLKETELQPGLQLQLNLIQYVSYSPKEDFEEFIDRLKGILVKKAPGISVDTEAEDYVPPPVSNIVMPSNQPPPRVKKPFPKKPLFIALLAVVLTAVIGTAAFIINNSRQGGYVDTRDRGVRPANASISPDDSRDAGDESTAPSDTEDTEPAELTATTDGDNYLVTLTGTGSLEFANIFAVRLEMPKFSNNVRRDYAIYNSNNIATDYVTNASSHGNHLEPGMRIVISLTNPADVTNVIIPSALLDSAITVRALNTPAVKYLTLEGEGSLEFINTSEYSRSAPKSLGNTRRDYVLYNEEGIVTAYEYNSTNMETIVPGGRKIISLTNTSDSLVFIYPAEWDNGLMTIKSHETHALTYVTLTGTGSIEFLNSSSFDMNTPKTTGSARRDYAVYDKDGKVTTYHIGSTSRELLTPGMRKIVSVTNPSDTLVFFFPASWDNTAINQRPRETHAIRRILLEGGQSVRLTNISSNDVNMPKVNGNARSDYTIFDSDRNEVETRTNSASHGNSLAPRSSIVLTLTNPGGSPLEFYYPEDAVAGTFAIVMQ